MMVSAHSPTTNLYFRDRLALRPQIHCSFPQEVDYEAQNEDCQAKRHTDADVCRDVQARGTTFSYEEVVFVFS